MTSTSDTNARTATVTPARWTPSPLFVLGVILFWSGAITTATPASGTWLIPVMAFGYLLAGYSFWRALVNADLG